MTTWDEEGSSNVPEEKMSVTDIILKFGLFIILIAFIVIFRGRLGEMIMDKAWFIALSICAIYLIGIGTWAMMKNGTPKFTYNDGWIEIDPGIVPIEVGNFAIIIPAIKSTNVYFHFKSPVYVMPLDAIRHRGRNLIANVRMELVTIEELPENIRGYIIENKLKPPYYLGLADVDQYELMIEDPDRASGMERASVSYLIQALKEAYKMIAMLMKNLAEAYHVSEDTIAARVRIRDRLGPSALKGIGKAFYDKDKESEQQ